MSNRGSKMGSMIFSDEEKRYLRALLSWEPRNSEDLLRRKAERPLAGQFRVLVLGHEGCGKTAILTRFCKGSFAGENEPPNPECEGGCQRRIEIKNQMYLVDALELSPSKLSEGEYLRHAVAITEAVILVYDVRSRESFDLIPKLHQQIQEALKLDKRSHYGMILVGNKADNDESEDDDGCEEEEGAKGSDVSRRDRRQHRRMVTEGEGYELACRLGSEGPARCAFRETSARTGAHVENLFALLGAELLALRWLTQQRQEQEADMLAAMGQADGGDRADKPARKLAKWRVWARGRFRRASEDAEGKVSVGGAM